METEEFRCRVCGGQLEEIYDYGSIFLPDFIPTSKSPVVAPICVSICTKCDLMQLREPIDNVLLFSGREWYRRDLNSTTTKMLYDLVRRIQAEVPLRVGDWVLDIGANDGTLLSMYPSNIKTFGVSPAKSFEDVLAKRCTKHATDFFTGNYGIKFKVITSLWTISRTADVNRFVSRINLSLEEDGLLVLQFYDIVSFYKNHAVDIIRHEELIYPSTEWVISLLQKHNLYVYDAELVDHEGGCVRIYASKQRRERSKNLLEILEREHKITDNIYHNIEEFKYFIHASFKRIRKYCKLNTGYVVGAFSRGSTLLQYLKLYSMVYFEKALEINPRKYGRVLAGTSIEIVPEDEGIEDFPDFLLVLPWYLKEHFLSKYFKYMYAGGKLLFPLPTPEICSFEKHNGVGDIVCTPL